MCCPLMCLHKYSEEEKEEQLMKKTKRTTMKQKIVISKVEVNKEEN